jgi:uncharacterized surface protein with fasciclin (FAS1) repeats
MKQLLAYPLLVPLSAALLLAACDDIDDRDPSADQSIIDVAEDTAELSTFVAVLGFASVDDDLVDMLDDPGSFTVFAPTNAAFDALAVELTGAADATAADLLVEANRPLLRTVLEYHVLGGVVRAGDIELGMPITTVEGSIFKIEGEPLRIVDGRNREATIVTTNIQASNGVIHVVDRVILPADRSIVELASDEPELSILADAVVAAGLVDTLSNGGPFTVFAPTNDAFAALLVELDITRDELLADQALLTRVLTYHVVEGVVLEAQVPIGRPIETVETGSFTVGADLAITDERDRTANIIATDRFATNGVVHVIDAVLLPGSP